MTYQQKSQQKAKIPKANRKMSRTETQNSPIMIFTTYTRIRIKCVRKSRVHAVAVTKVRIKAQDHINQLQRTIISKVSAQNPKRKKNQSKLAPQKKGRLKANLNRQLNLVMSWREIKLLQYFRSRIIRILWTCSRSNMKFRASFRLTAKNLPIPRKRQIHTWVEIHRCKMNGKVITTRTRLALDLSESNRLTQPVRAKSASEQRLKQAHQAERRCREEMVVHCSELLGLNITHSLTNIAQELFQGWTAWTSKQLDAQPPHKAATPGTNRIQTLKSNCAACQP